MIERYFTDFLQVPSPVAHAEIELKKAGFWGFGWFRQCPLCKSHVKCFRAYRKDTGKKIEIDTVSIRFDDMSGTQPPSEVPLLRVCKNAHGTMVTKTHTLARRPIYFVHQLDFGNGKFELLYRSYREP